MSSVKPGSKYRVYAGLTDEGLAWVTPIGVAVPVPQNPAITGLELPLAFRPDLLKGAVTGTITGVGLDPATDPSSYGTAEIVRTDTGETVGFQLINPVGSTPIDFSVPFDPLQLNRDTQYVARASVWDGTRLWTVDDAVPVITDGNPKSDVKLVVSEAPTPSPSPSPTPAATAAPTPEASPAPTDGGSGNPLDLVTILVVVILGGLGVGAVQAYRKVRGPQPPSI